MFKYVLPALAGVMLASAAIPAYAADIIIEEPVYEPKYIEPKAFGGWYLRGHIGMSNQRLKRLDYEYFATSVDTQEWLHRGSFSSGPTFGVGFGYAFNDWLRTDVTAEYRGKTTFKALDRFLDEDGDVTTINDYTAKKSEWLFLANAYGDLGTFKGITPYVGAGLGFSRNTISSFIDSNTFTSGGGYAGTGHEWQFAWALHAGVGYELSDRATLDLGYSFVNLGDATTGQAFNFDPDLSRPNDGFKFKDITSHDFKLGLRYKF